MPAPEPRRRRPNLRQGVIILPSAFTLGNLFFGMYAMVAASRGDFVWAGWFIIFAGILDMLDGRVARFTRTGSAFGAELDSLVDAISFGVAPAFIMYEIFFHDAESWSWTLSYAFVVAAVVRLARFNVDQGGEAKRHFVGLPSTSAGMALASYYPFSQTPFFDIWLSDWPWDRIMATSMVLLAVLMVSQVPYAKVPRIGFRTWKLRAMTVWILTLLFLAVTIPRYYFFSALSIYIVWGLLKSVLLGFLDRLPDRDPLEDEDEDGEDDDHPDYVRDIDYTEIHARHRGSPSTPPRRTE